MCVGALEKEPVSENGSQRPPTVVDNFANGVVVALVAGLPKYHPNFRFDGRKEPHTARHGISYAAATDTRGVFHIFDLLYWKQGFWGDGAWKRFATNSIRFDPA